MHDDSKVVKSGIDAIDKELKGGWHEKTLSLLIAPTNVGKTLCKCSFAANAFLAGKNVLYVTMEMSEEEISKRLFVNVANISMDELESMTREELRKGYSSIIGKSNRLFVKEYPTGGANTNTLRNLLKELKVKQNFVPDVMFVDYMGIMQPNRHTPGDNTNTKYKTISIELRGLAVEQKLAIVSSNQANRGGFGKAELDLTDTADSIAQTNTADVIMTIGQDNEMRDSGKYNFITSKNRFNRRGKVIQLNVDFSRMKVFEIGDDEKIDRSLATMKTLAKKTEKENLETTKKFAGLK
jgi:replicative DNA helicase